jgi:hypothetical protein
MEMDLREPNAIIDTPVSAENVPMPGRGFLSGRYSIICHERIGGSALYSFLDIHARSSHTNAARWTTIEIDNQFSRMPLPRSSISLRHFVRKSAIFRLFFLIRDFD